MRRIAQLYQIVYQRMPTPDEITLGTQFVGPEEGAEQPQVAEVWQYGYGGYDESTHRTRHFKPMSHFAAGVWQAGAELPDSELGFVSLTAGGGHPGRDLQHAAIRRWVSPIDGIVRISGTVEHKETQGDGVRARIISSRQGELASWNVFHRQASTDLDNIEVRKGDTIDFLVDCNTNDGFDSFAWAPVINSSAPVAGNDGPAVWSAATEFGGTHAKPLDAWVKYAQVLLESNEFVFID